MNDSLRQERILALLTGSFAALALLLAGLGLYGVTAYAVARRRTEIGIRMALGAVQTTVVRLVVSRVATGWHRRRCRNRGQSLAVQVRRLPSLRTRTRRPDDAPGCCCRAWGCRYHGRSTAGNAGIEDRSSRGVAGELRPSSDQLKSLERAVTTYLTNHEGSVLTGRGVRQSGRRKRCNDSHLLVPYLAAGLLSAQTKPNFSGTWTLVSSDAREPAAGVKRFVVILDQTESALTLRNEKGDPTSVFPLDGSESTIKGTNGPDVTVRTRWEGAQFVVEQRTPTTAIITTVRLSDDRNELTVETLAQGPQ